MLDALDEVAARDVLTSCCGARPWVDAMLAARPWRDDATLLACADRCWAALTSTQIAEAVAHHPRLGEAKAAATLSARASEWSAGEQSGASAADDAEMLAALRERVKNDPATELRITAAELHKITRLRLDKLLASA